MLGRYISLIIYFGGVKLGWFNVQPVLETGLADFDVPGSTCQKGPCESNAQCDRSCFAKGYKNGGICIGFVPSVLVCCCYNNIWFIIYQCNVWK